MNIFDKQFMTFESCFKKFDYMHYSYIFTDTYIPVLQNFTNDEILPSNLGSTNSSEMSCKIFIALFWQIQLFQCDKKRYLISLKQTTNNYSI